MRAALLPFVVALTACSDLKTAAPRDGGAAGAPDAGAREDVPRGSSSRTASAGAGDASRDAGVDGAPDAGHAPDAAREAATDAPERDAGKDATMRDAGEDARGGDAAADGPVGAVCTSATCTVVTMADKLHDPVAVAVDGQFVYWLEFGGIGSEDYGELVQILKDTPCLTPSCYGVLDPFVLPADSAGEAMMGLGPGAVCYTQSFDYPEEHAVKCVVLSSGAELSLEVGDGFAEGVWVGPSGAVWALAGSGAPVDDGAVHAGTFTDAGPTSLASGRAQPWAVTSDGTTVYWTELGVAVDGGADAAIGAVYASAGDGGATRLAGMQNGPLSVALYGGYLYWTNAGDGSVWRVLVGTSPGAPENVAVGLVTPFAVAVDASGIYVASAGTSPRYLDGALTHFAAPRATGTVMLSDQNELEGLALDDGYAYVAVAGSLNASGAILRIPKTR